MATLVPGGGKWLVAELDVLIAMILASRLRVPMATPFGWPVEPEVYCRKEISECAAGAVRRGNQLSSQAASSASRSGDSSSVACHTHSAGHAQSASRISLLGRQGGRGQGQAAGQAEWYSCGGPVEPRGADVDA